MCHLFSKENASQAQGMGNLAYKKVCKMLDLTNICDSDRLLLGRITTPRCITTGQQPIATNGFLPKLTHVPYQAQGVQKSRHDGAFAISGMKHCPSCHSTHINSNGCFDCGMRFSEKHKDFGNGYTVYEAGEYYSILTPSSCVVLPRDIFWNIVTEYCGMLMKGKT